MSDYEETKYFDKDGVEVGPLLAKTVAVRVIRYTYRDGKLLKHEEFDATDNPPSLKELETGVPSRFLMSKEDVKFREDDAQGGGP
jgi:hypothetical protein